MTIDGVRVEDDMPLDPERERLSEAHAGRVPWYRWGPYLSARQWGTVREDYSANGDAWNYWVTWLVDCHFRA